MWPLRTTLFIFPLFLFFILLSPQEAQAKKKSKQKGDDDSPAGTSLGSGELTTKEGHRCTWETLEGGANVILQVSCSTAGEGLGQTYECRFAGKPEQCSAYNSKSSQYWKQVVGKLKKRGNACEGERVLKTRLCKKAPAESHMKLTERTGEETTTGLSERMKEEKKKKETAAPTMNDKEMEEAKKEGKETAPVPEARDGEVNDGFSDMEPAENYCGEGWHSICRFFVRFFDG
ncbi:fibroblast growth factor-binding protein 1 [Chanos chanos]|uniref:Fibroblast growth factor-binding protein 1 n=1 Tax=Chanos chanos TaxID=29144 RepID=A0A6J2WGE4_CHACN|nr:fibroblast growth factor-binding protein 1-like [Chanos chanos]